MRTRYVIFDGECGFCNRVIIFIANRDIKNNFIFVSNLSNLGLKLINKYCLQETSRKSIILIYDNKSFYKSVALQKIIAQLPRCKIWGLLLRIIPNFMINKCYDFISSNRKKFYKNSKCVILQASIKKKFVL